MDDEEEEFRSDLGQQSSLNQGGGGLGFLYGGYSGYG